MAQRSWEDNQDRLGMASRLAVEAGHRVAIRFETPKPASLRNDVALLLQGQESAESAFASGLRGVVAENGEMLEVTPFIEPRTAPLVVAVTPIVELPKEFARTLNDGIAIRRYGLIIVGSNSKAESRATLLEAILPLTEHAGPAARIQPTFDLGYGGDEPLSDRFVGIPVLPSVESAYASGYRRMILEKVYSSEEVIWEYAGDVCFLVAAHGTHVGDPLLGAASSKVADDVDCLKKIIAVLCRAEFETKLGTFTICDTFAAQVDSPTRGGFEENSKFTESHRTVRWEDQLEALLAKGLVTVAQIKKEFRGHDLSGFLKARKKGAMPA